MTLRGETPIVWRRGLVIFLSLLLISACGWRLRGSVALPPSINAIYLQGDAELIMAPMRELLRANDVRVADGISQAQLVVDIQDYEEERRVVSVGANTRVSEYELIAEARFSIIDAQGHQLLPDGEASLIRSYQYDQNNVLAMEAEERLIMEEMRRELARQIIGRLRFIDLTSANEAVDPDGQTVD